MKNSRFRGIKDPIEETHEWVYGHRLQDNICYRLAEDVSKLHVIPVYAETICENTGLEDSEGTEIYEGDLWQLDRSSQICAVVWYQFDAAFRFKVVSTGGLMGMAIAEEGKVIGNIFENNYAVG